MLRGRNDPFRARLSELRWMAKWIPLGCETTLPNYLLLSQDVFPHIVCSQAEVRPVLTVEEVEVGVGRC